jgi:preprotein translocase subunit SecG
MTLRELKNEGSSEGEASCPEGECRLMEYFDDMRDLKRSMTDTVEQTRLLHTSQTRIADSLEHINDKLGHFMSLGDGVVKLFSRITIVFIGVVMVMALLVMWISHYEFSYKDFHLKHQAESGPTK